MIGGRPLGNPVYSCLWRSILLVVHKLLKDEEEDLGDVFQEFEFLMHCHRRSGNLFQGMSSQCVGMSRNSVVFDSTATWHSVGKEFVNKGTASNVESWRFSTK